MCASMSCLTARTGASTRKHSGVPLLKRRRDGDVAVAGRSLLASKIWTLTACHAAPRSPEPGAAAPVEGRGTRSSGASAATAAAAAAAAAALPARAQQRPSPTQQQPREQFESPSQPPSPPPPGGMPDVPPPLPAAVPPDALLEFESKLESDLQSVAVTLTAVTGVIIYWRGVWSLLDALLGDSLLGDVCCIVAGLTIVLGIRLSGIKVASTFWPPG